MAFPDNLRRLRRERFMSQAELGVKAGLHKHTVMRLEAGETAPRPHTVRALAEALNLAPSDLASPDEIVEGRRGEAAA